MQVDAIEQRTGDTRAIALDAVAAATATTRCVAGPAAGTGIHRGDELEARRKLALPRGTGDGDDAGFERLAQHFQCLPRPLRKFVQEQDAVVRKRNLAGPRLRTTTDQRDGTGGVVRRAIRALQPACRIESAAADGRDGGRLQRFGFTGFRQQTRQARREQRLAATRWSDEQQVVVAGRGDLQRAPRMRLSAHVRQVGSGAVLQRECDRLRQGLAAGQRATDFKQRACGGRFDLARQRGFGAVARGHDQLAPGLRRGESRRQRAIDGAQFASQPELAEEFVSVQAIERNLPAGGENAECDRQVEAAAVLRQVGRRQVHGDHPCRELELRALDRRAHAILRLAHRGLRQPDDRHPRQSAGQVHLDAHRGRVHARSRTAVHECQTHGRVSAAWT